MAKMARRCRTCGVENKPDARFCRNCGRSFFVPEQRQQMPPKQKQNNPSQQAVYGTAGKTTSQRVPSQAQVRNVASQQKDRHGKQRSKFMKWRSPNVLIILLTVFLVLIIGIGGLIFYFRSSSTSITIVWQADSASFSQQDRQGIQNAWEADLVAPSSSASTIANHTFTIITVHRQGDWAIFTANERVNPNAQPIPTEPLFFLAHLQGGNWVVWIPSSVGFCQELNQVPGTLLNSTDKRLFC